MLGRGPAYCVERIPKGSVMTILEYNLTASVANFISLQYTSHKLLDGYYNNLRMTYSPTRVYSWNKNLNHLAWKPAAQTFEMDTALQVNLDSGYAAIQIEGTAVAMVNRTQVSEALDERGRILIFNLRDDTFWAEKNDDEKIKLTIFSIPNDSLETRLGSEDTDLVDSMDTSLQNSCATWHRNVQK